MFKALWRQGPFALMATGVIIAIVVLSVGVSFVLVPSANAYVPPIPKVQLVKLFTCDTWSQGAQKCGVQLERQVNAWLEKTPKAMILDTKIVTNNYSLVILVIYEEYRRPSPPPVKKLPAEAP